MHETMVAQSLLAAIKDEAKKLDARPIKARISCGQLNPINDEALSFAFEMAAAGTVCEKMALEIVHVPLSAVCRKCNKSFDIDVRSPVCPQCGGNDFEIQPDAPLLLEEIEFEDR